MRSSRTARVHHRPKPSRKKRGDPGKPRRPQPKDSVSGRTETQSVGTCERPKHHGDMGSGRSEEPEIKRSFGVTRRFSLTKPEGERTGETREDSSAGTGRYRFWGNSELGRRRYRRIAVRGNPETINRHRRRIRTSTRLEDRSPVKPEGAARRETCSEHRRRSRKRGEPGQLGALQPAAPKDARFESPRRSIAGNSQRIARRGNSKRDRRRSQWTCGTG